MAQVKRVEGRGRRQAVERAMQFLAELRGLRQGLTYEELRERLGGVSLRTVKRWAYAAQGAGLAEVWYESEHVTQRRARVRLLGTWR